MRCSRNGLKTGVERDHGRLITKLSSSNELILIRYDPLLLLSVTLLFHQIFFSILVNCSDHVFKSSINWHINFASDRQGRIRLFIAHPH
jgi:hypothetical protein